MSTDAPAMTLEAVMYALRSEGVSALNKAETRLRLRDLSVAQRREVSERLRALQGRHYCSGITPDLLVFAKEFADE